MLVYSSTSSRGHLRQATTAPGAGRSDLEVCKAPPATTTLKVVAHLMFVYSSTSSRGHLRQATTAPGAGVLI